MKKYNLEYVPEWQSYIARTEAGGHFYSIKKDINEVKYTWTMDFSVSREAQDLIQKCNPRRVNDAYSCRIKLETDQRYTYELMLKVDGDAGILTLSKF